VDTTSLPTGTVTFLLTDIEGNTRLWQQHPEAMRDALARHDALAAAVIERHGGTLVKSRGEGDSLFAAFYRATDAVAAACTLQHAFLAEPWAAETTLWVRIALHTGEAEVREHDYYGAVVSRCARARAAAHGGQVLLSSATQELVQDVLPPGVSLQDLGVHRLRDLQRAEHVFQLLHSDLPSDFPPLRSLDALPNNLPQQVTSFIGREEETAPVKRLLETTRLLTLTGAGGTGKTRLALQVAAELLPSHPDAVWLVDLAPLADPDLVPQTVAAALGVREAPGKPLLQTVVETLKPKRLLLLADNGEHLLADCAGLADALPRGCPDVQILATSREGLNIPGETTYRLPSLSLPPPTALAPGGHPAPTSESLTQYESVRLFIDRATAAVPAFAVTNANAFAVAQLCHRLDGIPLVIELAAARVKALPVEKLAERLDDRFRLLTGGSRTALPRQQTLRALIDWSYNLLSEPERALLRRLSVFAGGWTLEAAEDVCPDESGDDVLDLLTALVEKSLVVYEEAAGEGRYRLLETLRQYGRDRLLESGEAETIRERHLDFFLRLAETAGPELQGAQQGVWLEPLAAELDNLRAALAWGVQSEPASALRLAVALDWFWETRGYWAEGRDALERALERATAVPPAQRAKGLGLSGWLAHRQGDYARAKELEEASLAMSRALGDQDRIARSLNTLGNIASATGEYEAARALHEESLAISCALQDRRSIAGCLNNLGLVAEGLGDIAAAQALYEEALGISREVGNRRAESIHLVNLGRLACKQGDSAAAWMRYHESMRVAREIGDRRVLAQNLEGVAKLAGASAEAERTARLFGAAETLRDAIGGPLTHLEQAGYDRSVAAVRTALGEAAFAAAWAERRALSLEQAIGFALEERDA
jgi:predicted ATPase/class 3 adenylate cyclase